MLVLSRKPGETIGIGVDLTITLLEILGHRVRIGIKALKQVTILRAELGDFFLAAHPDRDLPVSPPQASTVADAAGSVCDV